MIRYRLQCENNHQFDAWFANSQAYDDQRAKNLIECSICGTSCVEKTLMTPSVSSSKKEDTSEKSPLSGSIDQRAAVLSYISSVRKVILEKTDDVGDNFTQEVRDMHDGITEKRNVRGQAKVEEVKELIEDGIDIMPIPDIPQSD